MSMGEYQGETKEQARIRFLTNYLNLVVAPDMDWFDQHVPSLVKIATQDHEQGHSQPWHTAVTPMVAPTAPARRGQSARKKLLADSLDRLGGIYNQVEPELVPA